MIDGQFINIAGCFGVTLLLIAALYYLINRKMESISDDVSFLLRKNKEHGDNIERLERVVIPEKQHPPKVGPMAIGVIRADVETTAIQNMPIIDKYTTAFDPDLKVDFNFEDFNAKLALLIRSKEIKNMTKGGIATGVSLGPSDWERTSTEFIAPLSKLKEIVCPPALMAEVSGLYIIPLTASCPPVLQIEDIKSTVGNYGQNN